jgi:hypothetical protein
MYKRGKQGDAPLATRRSKITPPPSTGRATDYQYTLHTTRRPDRQRACVPLLVHLLP